MNSGNKLWRQEYDFWAPITMPHLYHEDFEELSDEKKKEIIDSFNPEKEKDVIVRTLSTHEFQGKKIMNHEDKKEYEKKDLEELRKILLISKYKIHPVRFKRYMARYYEEEAFYEDYIEQSDTEKILRILYKNKELTRKDLTKILLCPPVPSVPFCLQVSPLYEKNLSRGQGGTYRDQGDRGTGSVEKNQKDEKQTEYTKKYDNVKKYLKRLLKSGKIDVISGKQNKYRLTFETEEDIKKNIETKRDYKFEQEKKLDENEEYTTIKNFWMKYIEKHYNGVDEELVIDIDKFREEAGKVHYGHEIYNKFWEEPKEQFKLIGFAFEYKFDRKPEIIIQGEFKEPKTPKNIRNEKGLIMIECRVDYKTDIKKAKDKIKYECPSCHNIITIVNQYFLRDKYKEPKHCSCGRKGGFIELNYDSISYQKMLVSDLEVNLNPGEQPVQKNAILTGGLITTTYERHLNIGDKVRLIGYLEEYTEFDSDSQIIQYFRVMGYEQIEKIDYSKKFNKEDIKKFEEFSKQENAIEKFAENLFIRHNGDDLAKKIVALQLFSGFKKNGQRQSLHVLLFGEPGTGKSADFLEVCDEFHYRSKKITQNNNSAAGISISSVDNEFLKKKIHEAGTLLEANKGILAIDELNDVNREMVGPIVEAMESGSITSNKTGAKGKYPADIKLIATMNPVSRDNKFNPDTSLFDQPTGMSGKFIDRFDFVIPFVNKTSFEEAFEVHEMCHGRRRDIDIEFLRRYMVFSEQFEPEMSKELSLEFKRLFIQLGFIENNLNSQSQHRVIRKCHNLVKAVARFHLSETVEKEHIKIASQIYSKYISKIQFFNESNENTYSSDNVKSYKKSDNQPSPNTRGALSSRILSLLKESPKYFDDIVSSVNESYDAVENELSRLSSIGEVYEERDRRWRLLE